MPYSFSGRCYENTAEVLKAFRHHFPQADGEGIATLEASSISESGLISYTIQSRTWATGLQYTNSTTVQLPVCTESYINLFEPFAIQDVAIAIGLIFAFLIGMATGYQR